jgi:hypothetical protein
LRNSTYLKLKELFDSEFTESEVSRREGILKQLYSNAKNADRLIDLVWAE